MKLQAGVFAKFAAHNFESAGTYDELIDAVFPSATKGMRALPIAGALTGGAAGVAGGTLARPALEPLARLWGASRRRHPLAATAARVAAEQAPTVGGAMGGAIGKTTGEAAEGTGRWLLKKLLQAGV
jgi:hypothetical protein